MEEKTGDLVVIERSLPIDIVGSRKSGIAPVSLRVFEGKQFGDRSIAVVETVEWRVLTVKRSFVSVTNKGR